VGLFLVVFHFAVPFALLLSRQLKRKARTLVWLATGSCSCASSIFIGILSLRRIRRFT